MNLENSAVLRSGQLLVWTLLIALATVAGAQPIVTTLPAIAVSNNFARLTGMINPNGESTTAWFEWGLRPGRYSEQTQPIALGNGSTILSLSRDVTGLTPGLLYHFRLVATNRSGLVRGRDVALGTPTLFLHGGTVITNDFNKPFVDPGATASKDFAVAIGAGRRRSLALRADGRPVAWGEYSTGEYAVPTNLSKVLTIAAGNYFNVALQANGTPVCWGRNFVNETNVTENAINVKALAAGGFQTLALRADGSVVVWGQLRILPESLSNPVALAAGEWHFLALRADGTVQAWGAGEPDSQILESWNFGQSIVPAHATNVVAIAGGYGHSLAARADGSVLAWGITNGTPVYGFSQTEVPTDATNVVALAGGVFHSTALRADGTVVAWGKNDWGQTDVPADATNVVAITAGSSHNLALRADGTVVTWGRGDLGQTVVPEELNPSLVVSVQGEVDITTPGSYLLTYTVTNGLRGVTTATRTVIVSPPEKPVATTRTATWSTSTTIVFGATVNPNGAATKAWFEWGEAPLPFNRRTPPSDWGDGFLPINLVHALGPLSPGVVYHFRFVATNSAGRVNGQTMTFGAPVVTINGGAIMTNTFNTEFMDPGAMARDFVHAIGTGWDHSLGLRTDGSVAAWGSNSQGQTNVPPSAVNATAISAGRLHNLALREDSTIVAWGSNDYGQTNVPPIAGKVTAVAAGHFHSLALREDGTVVAWGRNDFGQTNVPATATSVVAIAGGGLHSLALREDGTVVAWGHVNFGQTKVPDDATNVVAISAGLYFNLALREDGKVLAWGRNDGGQTMVPDSATNMVAIAAGGLHALAVREDGTILAWGDNSQGQTNVIDSATNVVAVAASGFHSLALRNNGTLVAWGENTYGQTNVPAMVNASLPVTVSGNVNASEPGTYVLTYTVTNFFGAVGTATRTVVVTEAQPVDLAISSVRQLDDGTFQLSFTNLSGFGFTVLSTTNLSLPTIQWTELGAATETPPRFYEFIDRTTTNSPQRFYRLRYP